MKTIITMMILILFGNYSHIFAQNLSNDSDYLIVTMDAAVEMALEYTGFGEMNGFSSKDNLEKAELVIINDDKTPFLHTQINGKKIWKVVFKDVQLSFESRVIEQEKFHHKFNVLIDPETGQLLKIYSKYEGDVQDFLPEPSAEWAERGLRGTGEFSLGIPENNEYISFYKALNIRCPIKVKEISANLILVDRPHNEQMAVWSITFRGTPPYLAKGPGADKIPLYGLNFVRNVYDATTGQVLYWTSVPIPNPADTVYLTK